MRLSRLELRVMRALWHAGTQSIREIQESFPARGRPAYTTVQTTVYRLENKGAVRRTKKIGNAHLFEASIARSAAERRVVDDVLALFGGRTQPLMAQLVESGRLTLEDLREAEQALKVAKKKESRS